LSLGGIEQSHRLSPHHLVDEGRYAGPQRLPAIEKQNAPAELIQSFDDAALFRLRQRLILYADRKAADNQSGGFKRRQRDPVLRIVHIERVQGWNEEVIQTGHRDQRCDRGLPKAGAE
jgi:hypothetical protein